MHSVAGRIESIRHFLFDFSFVGKDSPLPTPIEQDRVELLAKSCAIAHSFIDLITNHDLGIFEGNEEAEDIDLDDMDDVVTALKESVTREIEQLLPEEISHESKKRKTDSEVI